MKNVRPEFIVSRFCPSSLVLVKTCVTFRLFVLKNPVHCEIRALSSGVQSRFRRNELRF